ncbi:hypothetical protein P152DRAFT_476475 [Eremomyces bilateralis CBS 781.70]|uniref:Myb-like domain-containing protein n=1 Tax=Eremomyces bilateralis CBS 781.70 TaxID=1392243 RepID=A0A6G1FUL2_9PEZI|nr:uncharacterized protein P152DRAFT_476475 [Eremomyces bilateralis CBS 781.70]KAF1809341.1 hypothetical protein P152DRAFT_476475 [Eremomyces bilateralis CBS 781.70]
MAEGPYLPSSAHTTMEAMHSGLPTPGLATSHSSDLQYGVSGLVDVYSGGLQTVGSDDGYSHITYTSSMSMFPPHTSTTAEFAPPAYVFKGVEPPLQPLNAIGAYESLLPARPHSSPSTFGPSQEEIVWQGDPSKSPYSKTPLTRVPTFPTGEGSAFGFTLPVSRESSPMSREHRHSGSISSVTELYNPQPRRAYAHIAPNPNGLQQLHARKRKASVDEYDSPPVKRKRQTPPPLAGDMTEEDRLLVKLKDEDGLAWKDIAARFHSEFGKLYQVPALQMRLKRLREKMRLWTDVDLHALRMAYEYWERNKFEIISAKMAEFGAMEKWTPKQCSRKWHSIQTGSDYPSAIQTPAFSYTSSPTDGQPPAVFAPFIGMTPA